MMKSMTACGRATLALPLGRFSVEIQSVNKKFLEVQFSLPQELARYELPLKKLISARLFRGYVTAKFFAAFENQAPLVKIPNLPLVRQLKQGWEQIMKELGVTAPMQIHPELLVGQEELFLTSEPDEQDDAYGKLLETLLNNALDQLIAMREREGELLAKDFRQRLNLLTKALDKIAQLSAHTVQNYRKKLEERVKEFSCATHDQEERLLREICLFADRVDVTEELIRFKSHLAHFSEVLDTKNEAAGKTLEFILQELGREINTIGSKTADHEVSRLVVEVKTELERIREQVQNVE